MRKNLGSEIVCDGKFLEDGELVICGRVLAPQHRSLPNKVGVLGHHCDYCHDPAQAEALAAQLGVSQSVMRERYSTPAKAQKAIAAVKAAEAEAAEAAGEEAPAPKAKNGKAGKAAAADWPAS